MNYRLQFAIRNCIRIGNHKTAQVWEILVHDATNHIDEQLHVAQVVATIPRIDTKGNSPFRQLDQSVHHSGAILGINDCWAQENDSKSALRSRSRYELVGFKLRQRI